MYTNDWNFIKWKLPDKCRQAILNSHNITECYHQELNLSPHKKYDLFKLVTENGKEISIFCKHTTDNEMIMHRRIWDILQGEECFVKVPKCFGFWKNKLFMEHLHNSITLEQFLGSSCTFEELEVILKELGSFLAILHKNRLLHKDLNLSNILYSQATRTIYVIDFELSGECVDNFQDNMKEIQSIKRKLIGYVRNKETVDILTSSYNSKLMGMN